MSDIHLTKDREINLIEVFEVLWAGKWKIMATTVFGALIGFAFIVIKPEFYSGSTPVQKGEPLAFAQYSKLNEFMENNNISLSINENAIFDLFVNEFRDYEEVIGTVKSSDHVKKSIENLSEDDAQKVLIAFAKLFKLQSTTSRRETKWELSFEWHDDAEGMRLFDKVIKKTLLNSKNRLKESIEAVHTSLYLNKVTELEKLKKEIGLFEMTVADRKRKRVQYLTEQAEIARGLSLEFVDELSFENNRGAPAVALGLESVDELSSESKGRVPPFAVPHFFLGYKAIYEEIAAIESRTNSELLLMADGYLELTERIARLKKEVADFNFNYGTKIISNDDPDDWIEYESELFDVKSEKHSMLYLVIFVVLGGLMGVLYVLISSAVRKNNENSLSA